MLEGEIAGLSAVTKLADSKPEVVERREKLLEFLWNEYRASPLLARARAGKQSVTVSEEEMEEIRRKNPPFVSFG